jgi:AcrR family transcriptional regulator
VGFASVNSAVTVGWSGAGREVGGEGEVLLRFQIGEAPGLGGADVGVGVAAEGDARGCRVPAGAVAGLILDETGRDDAVTLRAIARRIGIAAPSIYAHFADRDAILTALVEDGFRDLSDAIRSAGDGVDNPVQRLRGICRAYLKFAARRPHRYQLMFGTRHHGPESGGYDTAAGAEAFHILVDAIRDCAGGSSISVDPFFGATTVWIALHGYATLHPARPDFPWPDEQRLIDHFLTALSRPLDPHVGGVQDTGDRRAR